MNELKNYGPDFLEAIVDALPDPVFVLDGDRCVVSCNAVAEDLFSDDTDRSLRRRGGDVLHCLEAVNSPDGCGSTAACEGCVINAATAEALGGGRVVREKVTLDVVNGDHVTEAHFLVTASPFAHDGDRFALLILEDINELIQLKKILPICISCKKIRNDQQYWDNVDSYFEKYLDLSFSHGLCPECMHELYPEFDEGGEG